MDANKEIKRVFELFTQNKFKEAQELNNQILEHFPNHMYAKRYQKILADKINFDNKTSWKSTKVKWKTLKCPHCVAKIPFSSLNQEQRNKIKWWNYSNLEIKCPYCHTSFVLQKRKAHSILGLKIWEQIIYKWKKYRITGYVEYFWHWYEDNYSGWLKYLEWLLLWEDNSYLYFSEWQSSGNWEWEDEFEFSEKFIPSNIWWIDYINWITEIDWKTYYKKEIDKIKVISIYWENSKNTRVWEKVELYDFWDFVIEKESSWSQSEAWFYKKNTVSWSEAAKIFWKQYNSFRNIWKKVGNNFFSWENILPIIFAVLFFFFPLIIDFFTSPVFWYTAISIVLLWILYMKKDSFWEEWKIAFYWLISIIITWFLSYFIGNSIFENKKLISLDEINNWKKYEINFTNPNLETNKIIWRKTYDYGWIKTSYKQIKWLKFSVKDENDKKIIEKIKKLKNNNYWNSVEEEKINKIFEQPIYKLK